MKTIEQLKDELNLDWLEISASGKIDIHTGLDLTPEQLQIIVDRAKQIRESNGE